MTSERRYTRQHNRTNKKHSPILTKILVDCIAHLQAVPNNIEHAQEIVDRLYQDWIRYCAQQKHFKGLAPQINAFVDNLVKMIR